MDHICHLFDRLTEDIKSKRHYRSALPVIADIKTEFDRVKTVCKYIRIASGPVDPENRHFTPGVTLHRLYRHQNNASLMIGETALKINNLQEQPMGFEIVDLQWMRRSAISRNGDGTIRPDLVAEWSPIDKQRFELEYGLV